ncbi:YceD family protein [Rhodococcus sp. 27YEA15]|uniref:YceD family protein n=1 Tax=Rhodococcus sp. 27YEA15 TaxID=3156259 RepID=UPI003C7A3F9E
MSKHRRHSSHQPSDAGFLLDTTVLGRRPGSMRVVARTIQSPSRIGLDLIAIESGSDIELDLRMEAVSEGVLVTGTVHAPTAGECSRCLEPFSSVVDLYLTELFAYPDSVTEETTEEGEVYGVEDDQIDLEPVIVDAVGLALPLQPLCSDDCLGLCSECGVRLAIAESGHGHDILDPRWAGLAAKFGVESVNSENLVITEAEEK